METTSIKVPITSGPTPRVARKRKLSTTTQRNQSKTKQFRNDLTGTKSVQHLQETIAKAFGLFFESTTHVNTHFTSNGKVMTLTCQANGLVTTITMVEKQEGDIS